MALSFYYLGIYIEIFFVFLCFMIIGIPILLFILKKIDERSSKISLPRKQRIWIAILGNVVLSLIAGLYIYLEPYRCDWAFDMAMEKSNLSLPCYFATNVYYPPESNDADDFCVNKTIKFLYSPSKQDIDQLEQLCQKDERWTKDGNDYHYHEEIFDEELKLDVVIDLNNNKATTKYLKW